MERKQLLSYLAIAGVGLAVMVGVVLFLRAKSAVPEGADIPLSSGSSAPRPTASKVSAPSGGKEKPAFKVIPYDQIPTADKVKLTAPQPRDFVLGPNGEVLVGTYSN